MPIVLSVTESDWTIGAVCVVAGVMNAVMHSTQAAMP
jgi:hypothetical protein